MKKNSKATKTETTTTTNGPTVKALMYRITTLTDAAAKRVQVAKADPATVYEYALREIDKAAATYWKHHANA